METPKLKDVYKAILRLTGMDVTEDGFVRMFIGDDNNGKAEYLPVTAKEGKQVVLPLPERVRDPNVLNHEVFHLLSDQSNTKDTDLMSRYRHWLINRFNIVLGSFADELLMIAGDKDKVKKLRPDQQGFLEMVGETDIDTARNFNKIAELAAKPNQLQKVFMTMYLKNAAVIKDAAGNSKSYNRVATVNFPFYEAIMELEAAEIEHKNTPKAKKAIKPEHEIFGVSIRKKDRPALIGLIRYLIPNIDQVGYYNYGSNSRIAPGLDALLHAMLPMIQHLNDVMLNFKGVDPTMDKAIDEMLFNLDWVEAFNDLDALWPQIRMTPTQGQGVAEEPEPQDPTTQGPKTAAAPPPPPWKPTPLAVPVGAGGYPSQPHQHGYPPPVPAPATQGGPVSVAAMMQNQHHGRHQPIPHGYAAPAPMAHSYGGYPAPATSHGYPAPGNQQPPRRRY